MIEELALVERVEKGHVWLRTSVKTTCHGCAQNAHCGTGVVARAFSEKSQLIDLPCQRPVQVGDTVKLGLPESTILSASALVYLVPLFIFIITAVIGRAILPAVGLSHELHLIVLSFSAASFGFFWTKSYVKKHANQYTPNILEVIPHSSDGITCFNPTK